MLSLLPPAGPQGAPHAGGGGTGAWRQQRPWCGLTAFNAIRLRDRWLDGVVSWGWSVGKKVPEQYIVRFCFCFVPENKLESLDSHPNCI